ncbi:dTDP-4-dehydrorhamnose 3,5-epimerase [Alkalimonas collagenimarina]|uniref:dTDP-4-dehydrorhamnose 3,5-epimerase n=1 Tax=Alkalimonas collagenimarina TaxID=400390 RepID=A0ABT9H0Q0_9GAMM|nr:dTDP-4-dehydrorhamnose 3,5-epimerase [Alkalimonas collagenimarina]MDP4536896.1 dTDP-4-dehydrorhamnose 3,5-epimerase [Alkalimonas collagenimarina]
MHIKPMAIPDVLLITPTVHQDERGFFMESFNQRQFDQALQGNIRFVQDNHSLSGLGVLRGLHYQINQPQGKLIRVLQGRIYDVMVDLRQHSATFKQWLGYELTAGSRQQLWIPPGFAHGFLALAESTETLYKTTSYYDPSSERCLDWNDQELAIEWPLAAPPVVSDKDKLGVPLAKAEFFNNDNFP